MIQSTKPQRTDAQCWEGALQRALDCALDVVCEPISGACFIESASEPGKLYAVSAQMCSCPAGQRGIPCKHRACYLAQIGELLLPETVRCISCTNGRIQEWTCGHPSGFVNCDVCGGSGRVPVLPQPARAPAVQSAPVAA